MERARSRNGFRRALAVRLAILVAVVAAPSGVARAQDLDLPAVERQALTSAPALVAARERLAALEAAAGGAGRFDDPMFEVEAMDLVPGGGRPLEAIALVRQPLPGRGRRAAERAVAAAEVAQARAELAAAEQALLGEIRSRWAEIWSLQEERRLLEEAHPLVELVVESATARLAGDGSVRAVLEARLVLRRHEAMQEEVDARWFTAQSRLSELAGFPGGAQFPRVAALAELPSPETELAAAASASPRVAAATRRVDLARARLEATRLELRLGASIGAGVRTMEGDTTELVIAGGIELPLFRRRRVQPRIDAAQHELAAAGAELERERLAVRGELERLYLERIRIDRQLARLRDGLLPESGAAFEAARAALVDGSGTVGEAARMLQMWVEARFDESRLLAERFAARAAIGALLGDGSPSRVETTGGGNS